MTSSQQYTGCMQTNTKDTTSCHFHLEKWQENGFHCHKIDQLSGVYKTPANNHEFALLSIRTVWSIPQRHNTTPCKRSQLWEAGKLQQCCTVAIHRSFVPSHKRGCWVPNWCNCVRRPKFTILWWHVGEVSVFNKFFSDCRYMPQLQRFSSTKLCDGAEMAIFASCIFTEPHAAHFRHAF